MPDYSKTKIYKILVEGNEYYGHTTLPIIRRQDLHITRFHDETRSKAKLFKAIEASGMNINDLELLHVEDYPCENKYQAKLREKYWIKNFGTLNGNIPLRTNAEYRADNKERIAKRVKEYRVNNADKLAESRKQKYREDIELSRAKSRENVKMYTDKEKKALWNKTKKSCPHCGNEITQGHFARHIKTVHADKI